MKNKDEKNNERADLAAAREFSERIYNRTEGGVDVDFSLEIPEIELISPVESNLHNEMAVSFAKRIQNRVAGSANEIPNLEESAKLDEQNSFSELPERKNFPPAALSFATRIRSRIDGHSVEPLVLNAHETEISSNQKLPDKER